MAVEASPPALNPTAPAFRPRRNAAVAADRHLLSQDKWGGNGWKLLFSVRVQHPVTRTLIPRNLPLTQME